MKKKYSKDLSFSDKAAKLVANCARAVLNARDKSKRFFGKSFNKDNISNLSLKVENGLEKTKSFVIENKMYVGIGSGAAVVLGIAILAGPALMSKDLGGNEVALNSEMKAVAAQVAEPEVAMATEAIQDVEFKGELMSSQQLMDFGVSVYSLMVDDEEVAYFKTAEEANNVLVGLTSKYEDTEEVTYKDIFFNEDVEVVEQKKRASEFDAFKTEEEILAYIVKGTNEERSHQVKKGENFWVIAKSYGISVSDLEKANPDVKPERLQINQIISLIVPKPLVSVVTVHEAQYSEAIKFEVEYEETTNIYKGEYSVKSAGASGEREVVAEIAMLNGRETERTILQETILKEPVTKIVYKGTKPAPARIGTGTFSKPLSRGRISSAFGVWRGDHRHSGIDIAVGTGNSVKAADGGKVIFSGTRGAYGKCVEIDHGGLMTTLYAHNSKLLVKKGDKVFKGQKIALSGNTGRSTGPHLHFEVRKNGVPINPTKYVKF